MEKGDSMASAITLKGIDQAISNLKYRNKGTLKYKFVHNIRQYYTHEGCVESLTKIDHAELIKIIWDTNGDLEEIKNKRKNLNSIRSSVNADLKKLYDKGVNPEGIKIGSENIFVMSEDAKDKILKKFGHDLQPDQALKLDQIMDILKLAYETVSGSIALEETMIKNGSGKIDELKDLIRGLSKKVGLGFPESSKTAFEAGGRQTEFQGLIGDFNAVEGIENVDEEEVLDEIDDFEDEEVLEEVDEAEDVVIDENPEEDNFAGSVESSEIGFESGAKGDGKVATGCLTGEGDEKESDSVGFDGVIENLEIDEIEEIEDLKEDVEDIEDCDDNKILDDVEDVAEIEVDSKIKKNRLLAEAFDGYLGSMERYYNQYILIPGGEYLIGSKQPEKGGKAEQIVNLEPFYFGRFPITNGLFEIFVEKTGYKTTAEKVGYGDVYYGRFEKKKDAITGLITSLWNSSLCCKTVEGACWYRPFGPESSLHNKKNHPVVQISMEDAMAFAAWTGKRLPTENEWEAASRTGNGWIFPWGQKWEKDACNIEDSCTADTTPVDKYVMFENNLGIVDAMGNVLEWTHDDFDSVSKNNESKYQIVKGGSWVSGNDIRLFSRFKIDRESHSNILGFRCVAY